MVIGQLPQIGDLVVAGHVSVDLVHAAAGDVAAGGALRFGSSLRSALGGCVWCFPLGGGQGLVVHRAKVPSALVAGGTGRPWSRRAEVPSPHQERNTLQHFWTNRASWTPDSWHCPFVVLAEGQAVGVQGLLADDFATLRTVRTTSWLGRAYQGRGLGAEMRAAVLHLAFAGLGAVRAESGAWHDNAASLAVSRKLGYQENGDELRVRGEDPDREIRLVLAREAWEQHRRPDIDLVGLDPCLAYFGAVAGEWLLPSSRSGAGGP